MFSQVGVMGLGTMGRALARNLMSRGIKTSIWNRTQSKIDEFAADHPGPALHAPNSFEDFLNHLERPRKIIVMVDAGEATQSVLMHLLQVLEPGDMVMSGANEIFKVTEIQQSFLAQKGIHLLGVGVSGGEEGALKGPSLMPSGSQEAWHGFETILKSIAADDFKGKACVSYFGQGGAGHYIKMVHNGIEYAEMQMLSEAYDMLKTWYKLPHTEIAQIFKQWNKGPLNSFLTQCAVDVLERKENGQDLLDLIVDKSGQKGTGTWTSQEGLRLGVPIPSLTNAVFMRGISANFAERQVLSKVYQPEANCPNELLSSFVDHLEKALQSTRLANFEQGFALLRAANVDMKQEWDFSEIVRVWQGGCIIRCEILRELHDFFLENRGGKNLYEASFAQNLLKESLKSWRYVVALAAQHGVPVLGISSALAYFEAQSRKRLPANLIQGLRDRFGSHGYERFDEEGHFHTTWFIS
jgi:6-phosphogluconate dehydrogenase